MAVIAVILFLFAPMLGLLAWMIIMQRIRNAKAQTADGSGNKSPDITALFTNLASLSALSKPISVTNRLEAPAAPNLPRIRPNASRRLDKRKRYLHIALNSTLEEAGQIIRQLPSSDRILIEVGTPLLKIYGTDAVSRIRWMVPPDTYVVADNKCADLADREAQMMADAGANAATCLGVAPIETIDLFIESCRRSGIDSMIDMMNVENPLAVLKRLKTKPDVVILHRGVDESAFSKEKRIPYYQIKQIKGSYDVLVAVAGGDSIREVQSAIFNDADIVVVWKSFYTSTTETARLAQTFLSEIK